MKTCGIYAVVVDNYRYVYICENGMIFDSAKKAAQYVKEKYGKIVNVQAVCSGKRKTAAGLRFQWLKEAV